MSRRDGVLIVRFRRSNLSFLAGCPEGVKERVRLVPPLRGWSAVIPSHVFAPNLVLAHTRQPPRRRYSRTALIRIEGVGERRYFQRAPDLLKACRRLQMQRYRLGGKQVKVVIRALNVQVAK